MRRLRRATAESQSCTDTRNHSIRPHNFLGLSKDIDQVNLKDVSTEILGNHQIHSPLNFIFKGSFKEFRVWGSGMMLMMIIMMLFVSDRTFLIAKKKVENTSENWRFWGFRIGPAMPPIFWSYMDPRLGPKLLAPPWSELAEVGASLAAMRALGRADLLLRCGRIFCGRAVMSLPDLCVPTRLKRMLYPL